MSNHPKGGGLNIEEICKDIITVLKGEIRDENIRVTTDLNVVEIICSHEQPEERVLQPYS